MLGERLKAARRARKINQEEVAQFLGVKRQTYSAYEREVSIPDSLTLKRLADYYEVSTEYFFDGNGERFSALDEQEEKILMLARRAQRIPPELRLRIIQNFEDNIDIYLKAMDGAKED